MNFAKPRPTLEFRIPISPNEKFMRMVHYFLESLQEFGGPIGRAAHCVVSVGADEPPRDLKQEYPWTANYSVDFHWVERALFRQRSYAATGLDRLQIKSTADIVALIDADLLIAGDFDRIVREAFQSQCMHGFLAHVSPFSFPNASHIASQIWWNRIFSEGGLACPPLDQQYSGWALDWDNIYPEHGLTVSEEHRFGPIYYNYGFVIGPRNYIERMGDTFEAELDVVARVLQTGFNAQIANCLAFKRHNIPCKIMPLNYNFTLNVPDGPIRALNPDPHGEQGDDDIKVFHYIGGSLHFETPMSLENLLQKNDFDGAWQTFQDRLRMVHNKIITA